MTFEEALPMLLTAYAKEELVPFTGAGMSAKSCTLWFDFAVQLCSYAELPYLPVPNSTASDLIRLTDRAVQVLLNRSDQDMQQGVREALRGVDYQKVPEQTSYLAQIYWPLILTTNYDDWLIGHAAAQAWSGLQENQMRVLGRSAADCYEVLTSLYVRSPPILWTLQGFLGGQYQAHNPTFIAPYISPGLAEQVVVGHHQYQLVMHQEPHFRRAFSEVLRRRSLLFIGSGLQEDYLLNLFGEVQIMHGPGSLPHYALLRESDDLEMTSALLARYNIVPISYRHHTDLPKLLKQLADNVEERNTRGFREERHYALGFGVREHQNSLVLRQGSLPLPSADACSVVSVGLDQAGKPKLGTSAASFYKQAQKVHPQFEERYEPLKEEGSFSVVGLPHVYALAVRTPGVKQVDQRDLRLLAPAVKRFLLFCSDQGYKTVHFPLLAAGEGRNWHPSFSLIETVRGVRMFVAGLPESQTLPNIFVHIVDSAVLYPLRAGKLFVEDNLYCKEIRFWVIIERTRGVSERILLLRNPEDKLIDVARFLGLFEQGDWQTTISPPPTATTVATPLSNTWSMTLTSLGLSNYSTLVFYRAA